MKKEKTEAPTKDPTRGKVAEVPLDGPGAAAGTSVLEAKAALMVAAAMRTAHEIFLASMANIGQIKLIMRIAIKLVARLLARPASLGVWRSRIFCFAIISGIRRSEEEE